MNILQISHSFYPCHNAGGVVKGVYNLSKQLVKNGHTVTVYTTDGCTQRLKTVKNAKVVIDGIDVYYFRNISNWIRINLKIATPYFLPFIISKEIPSFDVIHIHEHRTVLAIITHHYAKKYGIPYIIQAHGDVLQSFHKETLKWIFDCLWGYRILQDAAKAIALTPIEADQYRQMGIRPENIEIIPNAFDSSIYANLPEKGGFKKLFNIPPNHQVILFLGRLHKIKGLELLIDSFADLNRMMDHVVLVIVGPDDGYMDQMTKQIKRLNLESKITYVGPLYDERKIQAYIDADVYVLPSVIETYPYTVLESLSCGTPVIVTNGCGIAEMISNEKIGVVVDYDKEQLTTTLSYILSNEKLRDELSKNGKLFITQKFDMNRIIDQWETLYQKVRNEKYCYTSDKK